MLKINISAGNFRESILIINHLRHFIQHFLNTICGCFRNHDHNEYESYHHQRHENLEGVHDNTGKLSCLHGSPDDALAAH